MNRIAIAALAAIFAGCSGDTKTDSGTESDTTDETTDTTCDTTFSGPVTVQEASVTCSGDVATFDVMTEGWTSGGYIYTIETANAQPWADEHDLESYEYDPCGTYDKLSAEVAHADLADLARNESTLFTCDDHFNAGVLTYAAAVIDLYGTVADCLAWGEDPQAVIDGSILSPYNYETGPSFDTSICVAGVRSN